MFAQKKADAVWLGRRSTGDAAKAREKDGRNGFTGKAK